MNNILHDITCCIVYIDDIIVFSPSLEQHRRDLARVLGRLAEYNLRCNDKCRFGLESVKALGFMNYYRQFVKNFSATAAPLYSLLKKETSQASGWVWTKEADNAFQLLKECMCTAPILRYPDFGKQFILTTDASSRGVGAVLSQKFDHQEHPTLLLSFLLHCLQQNQNMQLVNWNYLLVCELLIISVCI